jgi:hypothetical protein
MTNWTYIWMAYGLTWIVLASYSTYLRLRVRRAEEAARGAHDERGERR